MNKNVIKIDALKVCIKLAPVLSLRDAISMREQCSKGHELVAAEFVFYKLGFVEKADVLADTHNLPVVALKQEILLDT